MNLIGKAKAWLLVGMCAVGLAACASFGPIESGLSALPAAPDRYAHIGNGERLRYIESGQGQDLFVFLHGIPTSSYLWRNVTPSVGHGARTIAVDLPGYGLSDLPKDGDYSYQSQLKRLGTFLDQLPDRKFYLVVNDLGSLLGIDYAMSHPERIAGIVLIEAVFMPSEPWYDQLTTLQKALFLTMRSKSLAEFMIVTTNQMPSATFSLGIVRSLSAEEEAVYLRPYEDVERRRVMLDGPGPATMAPSGISQRPGDIADVMNKNAARLAKSPIPKLLLTAQPGLLVQSPAIEYAKRNLPALTINSVGAGKHFLPEDQPTAIAKAISAWHRSMAAAPPLVR